MQKTRTYGLYTGLIFSAALFMLTFVNPSHPKSSLEDFETALFYSFYICFPFLILFILMAMLGRRKELGNHIDFNEAFKSGLGVSAIAGAVFALFNYVYFKWINHDILVAIQAEQTKELLLAHKSVNEPVDDMMYNINKAPFIIATIRLVIVIFTGGLLSIGLALIVRRKHIEVLTETEDTEGITETE